jgi:hypothetical protein
MGRPLMAEKFQGQDRRPNRAQTEDYLNAAFSSGEVARIEGNRHNR